MEVEEGEGAVRHVGLDALDAGGGGVFAGFGVIVEEVWGSVAVGVSWGCGHERDGAWRGRAYRVSSGRDMFAVFSLKLENSRM